MVPSAIFYQFRRIKRNRINEGKKAWAALEGEDAEEEWEEREMGLEMREG